MAYSLPAYPTQYTRQERLYTSPARRLLNSRLRRYGVEVASIAHQLMELRQVKLPEEVALLQKAIEVTGQGFEAVRQAMQPGVYEYELAAHFDFVFAKNNCPHGYAPPIIAAGKNATILHYQDNSARMAKDDLVLFDVGAEHQLYTADISRTFKVSGQMSDREAAVYGAVERVHAFAQQFVKPGVSWRDYVIAVDEAMGEELITLGLIEKNERSLVRPFFPHSISHNLGLDVHDPSDYQLIPEGAVITSEPGIYIPEEGMGIRIEDDLLVTSTGTKNLSAGVRYQ